MNERANEPAYPVKRDLDDGGVHYLRHGGLTIREHFAGLMMQGLLAGQNFKVTDAWERKAFAQFAVQQADALIAALGEKK